MRYAVLGWSLTHIVLELGCSEPVVRPWMFRARFVMHLDALERQSKIVFGQAGRGATTEVEADETCIASWKEQPLPADPAEPVKFHWYVWFGLKERGTVDKLWLKCMGVRTSRDKATIPQISKDEYLEALQQAGFCERTAVVMHTDSDPTFTSTGHAGIVDSHSVNHAEHEYVRSVSILANVSLALISFSMLPAVHTVSTIGKVFSQPLSIFFHFPYHPRAQANKNLQASLLLHEYD